MFRLTTLILNSTITRYVRDILFYTIGVNVIMHYKMKLQLQTVHKRYINGT